MTAVVWQPLDLRAVGVLLCDADGNLFPSEEPAFAASVDVTNRLMASLGSPRRFGAEELRLASTGKNFRVTATDLAAAEGVALTPPILEHWVAEERRVVTAHLSRVLRPDPEVRGPLIRLAGGLRLAAVSSSASARLGGCFEATALDALFPPRVRFSAEDSLPRPRSKPDPAIYVHAGAELGVSGLRALAVEDSVPGAQSAVAAGFPTLGNLAFVPVGERRARARALRAAGVAGVVESWTDVENVVDGGRREGPR